MNISSFPYLFSTFLGILFAFLLFIKGKRSAASVPFAFDWIAVSMWWFGYAMMYSTKREDIALLWAKFAYVGIIFIPSFAYHFVISFLNLKDKIWSMILTYLGAFLSLMLLFFTNDFITRLHRCSWGYHTKVGYLHNFFLFYFVVVYVNLFYNLFRCYRERKPISSLEAVRVKYVLLCYLIAGMGSTDFLVHYGIVTYYPIGFIFVLIGLGITSYAILRHRLLDVNIVITRAGIFGSVYALVLGIPFIIGGILKSYLAKTVSNWWLIPVFIGVALASLGPFIYMRLQRRFESRLRAQEFKSHEALRRLSHNMLRVTNLNTLLKLMAHYLVKTLKLRFAAIYLLDSQKEKYLLNSSWQSGEGIELPQEFEVNNYLAEYLHLKKLPVVTEELSFYAPLASTPKIKKLFSDLSDFKINTVIPSFLRSSLLGFFILSDRRGNISFTQEDLNLLMVLSNEAALAIENAQFHQKEVAQIVEKSKREALADMAPGASHQFNNRLASISSSVELLLLKMENFNAEAHQDEKTKALLKDAKEALELIDNEVYKGKEITSAILKRAKAKVEFQEFNLVSLIENTYKLVMISCSLSGLDRARELKFNIISPSETLNIFASEALLQDAFYNLIDNAYDAIQDRVRLMSQDNLLFQGEIEVTLAQEDYVVKAQVRDNGIGLTKENQRKLFTPYFTTKATSNKGSGLGLCVIRDFIEMHKGTIACDSEYGKGTTFTIKLPVKKGET